MTSFDDRHPVYPDQREAGAGIGLQGAALVFELRKLQRALAEDIDERSRHRFADQEPAHSFGRGPASEFRSDLSPRSGGHSAHATLDSWMGMLGLGRRAAVARAAWSRFPDRLVHPRPRRSADRPAADARPRQPPARSDQRVVPIAPAIGRFEQLRIDAPREPAPGMRLVPEEREAPAAPPSGAARETAQSAIGQVVGQVVGQVAGQAVARLLPACGFLIGHRRDAGGDTDATLAVGARRAYDDELRTGLRVLLAGLGILGTWGTLVPLSGAVVVPGTLVVESSVKKIQHPTGGVVARISVQDGMHVNAGDLVLRLDETQVRTNARVLINQLDQARARIARLSAERNGMEAPTAPAELAGRLGDAEVGQLWASETSLFAGRAAARRGAKELLRSRIDQLGEQIAGLDAQIKSKAAQSDLISGELEGVESLYQKGLVPLTRKTSLQREAARLDGDRGQAASAIAEAKAKISEAELQIMRIDQDFRAEVMKDLRDAQDKEAELTEKGVAARDLLNRIDIRAPVSGIVHQLAVHTIGGVIAPGEAIMEIVPDSDDLQIEAHLPPQDIDQVRKGQKTYMRFSAFSQRTTPQLEGVVSYVSADLAHDRHTNAAYYTVRVTLPGGQRSRLGNVQLVSGMPVEVFLQTGQRTMMSYLLKPISDQLQRMFNER